MTETAPFQITIPETIEAVVHHVSNNAAVEKFNQHVSICSSCIYCNKNTIPFCSKINTPICVIANQESCPIGNW